MGLVAPAGTKKIDTNFLLSFLNMICFFQADHNLSLFVFSLLHWLISSRVFVLESMDLEVVGRHALFFDDDPMAAFVNSGDALVEWNSLSIDRYDVRHLLINPPPPRRRSHLSNQGRSSSSPPPPDHSLESELDQERYLDLPPQFDQQGISCIRFL